MKLKKIELAALAVTLAFACFTGGYLLGRSHPAGVVGEGVAPVVITSRVESESPSSADKAPNSPDPESSAPASDEPAPDKPAATYGSININTASRAELTDLPGIGDALAGRIIAYREQNGAFLSVEDIMKVSGIGEKKFEAIRDLITVE